MGIVTVASKDDGKVVMKIRKVNGGCSQMRHETEMLGKATRLMSDQNSDV